MPEPSTAVQVLSKLADVPAPLIKTATRLVESLLGEPLKVTGEALADHSKMWQWKNLVEMAAEAKRRMGEEKVAERVVLPSFLMPLLEGAGYTDDPNLREMWARVGRRFR